MAFEMQMEERGSQEWFLVSDVVNMLLMQMGDGKDLARCSGVNRLWHQHTTTEALWQQLVVHRWCQANVKRPNDGPLAEKGNFWKKRYAQWHCSGRQPSTSYLGDRFPAFAKTSGQRSKISPTHRGQHICRYKDASSLSSHRVVEGRQELYRVAERADGLAVREDDAEPWF